MCVSRYYGQINCHCRNLARVVALTKKKNNNNLFLLGRRNERHCAILELYNRINVLDSYGVFCFPPIVDLIAVQQTSLSMEVSVRQFRIQNAIIRRRYTR